MKNLPKTGRSGKRGNAPSPYQKYDKRPYEYSTAYHAWRRTAKRTAGRDADSARQHRGAVQG